MAGYQFIHLEVFPYSQSKLKGAGRARKGKKRSEGTGGWSARQVLAEALRETGAHPHVPRPGAPTMLVGDLQELAKQLDVLVLPKGQRKDTPILLAGVASAPWPPGDPRSRQWEVDTLAELQSMFGAHLRAALTHPDESYSHLHFYAAVDGWGPVKQLHPGFAARAAARADEKTGAQQVQAFNTAMRDFQDRYFENVAQRHGLARLGPGRRRLTRKGWREEQQQAEALLEANRKAKAVEEEAEALKEQAKALKEQAQVWVRDLKKTAVALKAERDNLTKERKALEIEKRDLEKKQRELDLQFKALCPEEQVIVKKRLDSLKNARPLGK